MTDDEQRDFDFLTGDGWEPIEITTVRWYSPDEKDPDLYSFQEAFFKAMMARTVVED